MTTTVLPLVPENQEFDASIDNTSYKFKIIWRGAFWCMDLMDSSGTAIVSGIPMVSGVDLLGQYQHLSLGFSLYVIGNDGLTDPTQYDLGINNKLCVVTE